MPIRDLRREFDYDREHFLELLAELGERFGTRRRAYVLMVNDGGGGGESNGTAVSAGPAEVERLERQLSNVEM